MQVYNLEDSKKVPNLIGGVCGKVILHLLKVMEELENETREHVEGNEGVAYKIVAEVFRLRFLKLKLD